MLIKRLSVSLCSLVLCLTLSLVLAATGLAAETPAGEIRSITSTEAHALWRATPGKAFVVDVRTPEEYAQGHPPMAANVPFLVRTAAWLPPTENQRFVEQMRRRYKTTDKLLIICRTGNRSLLAARRLVAAGFADVLNVVDGVEGQAPAAHGKPPARGWHNHGLPWTTDLDATLVYKPAN
ncbi:MAG: rhodanese-like domain-containing protein [Humidesulfovibrio sp.]|uniref:rhodanese-like domain-containing protein n=1 Tax=Humidesulfovibrio sp. TaxID=2910988 RepID=UPI0027E7C605|nr:rhodanese-like domain-containing protein [Humidesulfovibrio sp.]MDQ7836610.1 rhodanese-like domain-containing protein [Humidesulfovibrio sp.]